MATSSLQSTVDESQLATLAAHLAELLVRGDCIALGGELGAGKTTFARALIRALLDDPAHEVPSPTFALRQDYATARGAVAHFDFYRLSDARDIDELGFDEALSAAITIIEWPERGAELLPPDRIDIRLSESEAPTTRRIVISGHGRAAALVGKLQH